MNNKLWNLSLLTTSNSYLNVISFILPSSDNFSDIQNQVIPLPPIDDEQG